MSILQRKAKFLKANPQYNAKHVLVTGLAGTDGVVTGHRVRVINKDYDTVLQRDYKA